MKVENNNKYFNNSLLIKSIFYSLKIFFLLNIITLISCSNNTTNQCLKDYFKGTTNLNRLPSLRIIKEKKHDNDSGCEYIITIECSVFERDYFPNTIFYKNNKKFYIQFNDPKTKPAVIFDLSSKVGKEKNLVIETIDNKGSGLKETFSVILEKKLKCKNETVYVFRIKDFYRYYEDLFDIVYFVTDEAGVIGSYCSKFNDKGGEIYVAPGGNVCPEKIDYSKMEEREFR
jgi:hypothetical protein